MSVRPYRDIQRRKSRQIHVGSVPVGGDAPISVQTMTNTLTTDAKATIAQIRRAEEAGVDIVRVSCPDEGSTAALKEIVYEMRFDEVSTRFGEFGEFFVGLIMDPPAVLERARIPASSGH